MELLTSVHPSNSFCFAFDISFLSDSASGSDKGGCLEFCAFECTWWTTEVLYGGALAL